MVNKQPTADAHLEDCPGIAELIRLIRSGSLRVNLAGLKQETRPLTLQLRPTNGGTLCSGRAVMM